MASETIRLTPAQREAVAHDGHVSLNSCPGSGKTRVIVAKMLACAQTIASTPRRVACITYTNTAVHEIQDRLALHASNEEMTACEVSTIHGFCLNQIIRPFASRIPELSDGFEVIAPDSETFKEMVSTVMVRHKLHRRLAELFPSIQRRLDGTLFVPKDLPEGAANDFVALTSEPGLLTFADIVYYAAKLVTSDKEVALALGCRFAWILVDEFQDTTELQTAILQGIEKEHRTKLFMVGDPHQAIFGFAGARPELMSAVAKAIGARSDIVLNGNHRCSRYIVETTEHLLPRKPAMESVGRTKDCLEKPKHIHVATPLIGILGSFLPELKHFGIDFGNAAILAPQWPILYRLGRVLREKGIPVIGPGARPYRRSLEFAQFAEVVCAYLERPDGIGAIQAQRSLFQMLLLINGEAVWQVFSFDGKKVLLRILTAAANQRKTTTSAIKWLQSVSAEIDEILSGAEWVPAILKGKLTESGAAMVEAIRRNVTDDPEALLVDGLAMFARPEKCIHLLTMHSAKGREFDAVALVGFQEGLIPHFSNTTTAELDESRRLAYVAMTRARRVLQVITDESDNRNNKPSRYVSMAGL